MLSSMKKAKEKRVQVMIRMSDSLRERLKIQAKAEHKSFNAYVVGILEEAVEPEWPHVNLEDLPPAPWIDEIRALFPKNEGADVPDDFDWKEAKAAYLYEKYCKNEEQS